jgi:tellurite resistance protein TerC
VIWVWAGFLLFVGVILALDLGVFNRTPHAPTLREAMTFTVGTVLLACGFAVFVYFAYDGHWLGLGNTFDAVDRQVNDGRLAAVKFLTGYVVEMSLSMDNVFVIALIFEHLRVPLRFQHRVLFWGILGALVPSSCSRGSACCSRAPPSRRRRSRAGSRDGCAAISR